MTQEFSKTILAVDDSRSSLVVLSRVLSQAGYLVLEAYSGDSALDILQTVRPDLMILDIEMSNMDGYELCKKIKSDPAQAKTPILFISASDDISSKLHGFEVGAVDYLSKPFEAAEVLARVGTHLRVGDLQRELSKKIEALERANTQIQALLVRDELTGLYNRRYFVDQSTFLLEQMRRNPYFMSLAIIDVDHFKKVNDTFGHNVGDAVLQEISTIFRSRSRKTDIAARYGGEEFVLLLPNTPISNAVFHCDEIRKKIESHNWSHISPDLRVTISVGISGTEQFVNLEDLIGTADELLYQAKNSGRNQVLPPWLTVNVPTE